VLDIYFTAIRDRPVAILIACCTVRYVTATLGSAAGNGVWEIACGAAREAASVRGFILRDARVIAGLGARRTHAILEAIGVGRQRTAQAENEQRAPEAAAKDAVRPQ